MGWVCYRCTHLHTFALYVYILHAFGCYTFAVTLFADVPSCIVLHGLRIFIISFFPSAFAHFGYHVCCSSLSFCWLYVCYVFSYHHLDFATHTSISLWFWVYVCYVYWVWTSMLHARLSLHIACICSVLCISNNLIYTFGRCTILRFVWFSLRYVLRCCWLFWRYVTTLFFTLFSRWFVVDLRLHISLTYIIHYIPGFTSFTVTLPLVGTFVLVVTLICCGRVYVCLFVDYIVIRWNWVTFVASLSISLLILVASTFVHDSTILLVIYTILYIIGYLPFTVWFLYLFTYLIIVIYIWLHIFGYIWILFHIFLWFWFIWFCLLRLHLFASLSFTFYTLSFIYISHLHLQLIYIYYRFTFTTFGTGCIYSLFLRLYLYLLFGWIWTIYVYVYVDLYISRWCGFDLDVVYVCCYVATFLIAFRYVTFALFWTSLYTILCLSLSFLWLDLLHVYGHVGSLYIYLLFTRFDLFTVTLILLVVTFLSFRCLRSFWFL